MSGPSSINVDLINETVGTALDRREQELRTQLETMGSNPSTRDMLLWQQALQAWTMLVNLQSTCMKELSDALKGIIQKAS